MNKDTPQADKPLSPDTFKKMADDEIGQYAICSCWAKIRFGDTHCNNCGDQLVDDALLLLSPSE